MGSSIVRLAAIVPSTAPSAAPSDQQAQAQPIATVPISTNAMAEVLFAFELLARRGPGTCAWAAPLREEPIAFLLDTVSDAATLRGLDGELLYRNRAASRLGLTARAEAATERFEVAGRTYERRCLHCSLGGVNYVLEVVHELRREDDGR